MSPEDEKKPERKPLRRSKTTRKPAAGKKPPARKPAARADASEEEPAKKHADDEEPARAAKAGLEKPPRDAKAERGRRKPTLRDRKRKRGADRKRSRPKLGRLRTGEAIYLGAAILLFVLMFLTWFEISSSNQTGAVEEVTLLGRGGDAWHTLEVIPLFLMLAIAVAVGAAILRLARSAWKPVIAPGAAVCVLGLLAALLVLIRIVSPPGLGTPQLAGYEFSTTLQLPIFLALAAALGIAYGGWRAMDEEGTSFGGVAKRLETPKRPGRPKPPSGAKLTARPKSPSGAEPSARPKSTGSKSTGKPKPASGSKS